MKQSVIKQVNGLSLMGGGMRGIIMLYHIREIENRTGRKAWELFDLIVGTSTGGMIAVLLANGYSAAGLIALYENHGEGIFKKKFLRFGLFRPLHDDTYLNNTLRYYLSTTSFSKCLTKVAVVSYSIDHTDKYIFKSYKDHVEMYDVVRATVAAPTYFKPHEINGERFIDGGVVMNNPSMIAYVEMKKLFPNHTYCLVSLGTGRHESPLKEVKNGGGIAYWAELSVDVLLTEQSQQTDYLLDKLFDFNTGNYHLIDPILYRTSDRMNDASPVNIHQMKMDALDSIKQHQGTLDEILQNLL